MPQVTNFCFLGYQIIIFFSYKVYAGRPGSHGIFGLLVIFRRAKPLKTGRIKRRKSPVNWIDAQKNRWEVTFWKDKLVSKTNHITLAYPCFNGILNTQFGHAYCLALSISLHFVRFEYSLLGKKAGKSEGH